MTQQQQHYVFFFILSLLLLLVIQIHHFHVILAFLREHSIDYIATRPYLEMTNLGMTQLQQHFDLYILSCCYWFFKFITSMYFYFFLQRLAKIMTQHSHI